MTDQSVRGADRELLLQALSHVKSMRAFYGHRERVIRDELLERHRIAVADAIFTSPCGFEAATVPMPAWQIYARLREAEDLHRRMRRVP